MKTRVALLGAGGQVGTALRRIAPPSWEIACPSWRHDPSDWLDHLQPTVIINAAAYNAVEQAEHDRTAAFQANADAPGRLAAWTAAHGAYLLHLSTDYVFPGTSCEPIPEDAVPDPLNVYGASKAEGERRVLASGTNGCIIRTSAIFGVRTQPTGPHNFVERIAARTTTGTSFTVRDDLVFCPTWADDLAHIAVEKVASRANGIFHGTSAGQTTWYDWAREILRLAGRDVDQIQPTRGDAPGQARRPRNSVLADSHNHPATPWQDALEQYLRIRFA